MSATDAPSKKQLSYLRVLAEQTGTTFTTPKDRQDASREIKRLRQLKTRNGNHHEARPAGDDAAYAAAPHPSEIEGYGIGCKWRTTPPLPDRKPPTRAREQNGTQPASDGDRGALLSRYRHPEDGERQIVAIDVEHGTLVIDRTLTGQDARLVGTLSAEEPPQNARLLADMYVKDPQRGRCRRVTTNDLTGAAEDGENAAQIRWDVPLVLGVGLLARIAIVRGDGATELRWTLHGAQDAAPQVLSLRQVVGTTEDYHPAVGMTRAAIRAHICVRDIAVCPLRCELERVIASPIVLNRRLREHVQRATAAKQLTMSEIAWRCKRVKRDERGRQSGETSWLARRIGVLAEHGAKRATPWVHTDVLALIARDGLGISPREAEVPLD